MKSSEISTEHEITNRVAENLGLEPTTQLYRWFHPVMVQGIESGGMYLQGNLNNPTNIEDNYSGSPRYLKSSQLDRPGLNFSRRFDGDYKTFQKRTAGSMRMVDQGVNLRIYPDIGSSWDSVYFTLPHNEVFLVQAEEFDSMDLAISLRLRAYLNHLGINEEPQLVTNSGENGQDSRVLFYVPDSTGNSVATYVYFIAENSNSYQIALPEHQMGNWPLLEEAAIYRFLLDDRNFYAAYTSAGILVMRRDILADLQNSEEMALVNSLKGV